MYSSSHYCGSSSILATHVAITNGKYTVPHSRPFWIVWVLSDKAAKHGRLISINVISRTALEGVALLYRPQYACTSLHCPLLVLSSDISLFCKQKTSFSLPSCAMPPEMNLTFSSNYRYRWPWQGSTVSNVNAAVEGTLLLSLLWLARAQAGLQSRRQFLSFHLEVPYNSLIVTQIRKSLKHWFSSERSL